MKMQEFPESVEGWRYPKSKFLQSLPEAVRDDVTACAKEALAYQSEVAREPEREAENMKTENVVVAYPDLELFVPLVRPHV